MARYGTRPVLRKRKFVRVSPEKRVIIAQALVRDLPTKMLKQIAAEFGISYSVCYKIMRELVEVGKTYSLKRVSTEAQEKPESGEVQG